MIAIPITPEFYLRSNQFIWTTIHNLLKELNVLLSKTVFRPPYPNILELIKQIGPRCITTGQGSRQPDNVAKETIFLLALAHRA